MTDVIRAEFSGNERTIVIDCDITPSEACKTNKTSLYNEVLAALGLEQRNAEDCTYNNSFFAPFIFPWTGVVHERESYASVKAYLAKHSVSSHITGDGLKCQNGYLFSKEIYSIRPYAGAHSAELDPNVIPVLKYNIHGTPDLIAVTESANPTYYLSHNALYAFEIKTVSAMSTSDGEAAALREGVLNLIGMNVNNSFASPAIIVSNLNGKNFVLCICMTAENPLAYCIEIKKFSKFSNAVAYVENVVLDSVRGIRHCCTRDFGRPGSAPLVPRYSEVDAALEFNSSSVVVEEVDPLEEAFMSLCSEKKEDTFAEDVDEK